MWEVGTVFHEKQEGRLCAQHCLNAALQGPYFTAVDLSTIAQRLDDAEKLRMAENGIESVEYRDFIAQPSENMDDTGYFSIQVISQALQLWNLELIPFDSSDPFAKACRTDPTIAQAYIFNMKDHWFCVRRFIDGTQRALPALGEGGSAASPPTHTKRIWFNLNSVLSKPEYMSCLYIAEYLKQMKEECYSIFVVKGELPVCPADSQLPHFRPFTEAELAAKRIPLIDLTKSSKRKSQDEDEMQRAIRLSLEAAGLDPNTFGGPGRSVGGTSTSATGSNIRTLTGGDTDAELEAAMRLSMECFKDPADAVTASAPPLTPSASELRDKRLSYFDKIK